jgi:hypothetical protein
MLKPMFELPGRSDVDTVTVTAAFVRGEEPIKLSLKPGSDNLLGAGE